MTTVTNLNIRTEKAVKETAESIFAELGLNTPNEITIEAIAEGRRISADPDVKGYKSLSDLREALDEV